MDNNFNSLMIYKYRLIFLNICVILFLFITVSFHSQSELIAQPVQNFETTPFPPAGWTLESSGTLYWSRVTTASGYGTGTASAKFNFYSAPSGTVQSLITPSLKSSLPGDSLSFDEAYATYQSEVDSLIILTSVDNGSNYSTLVALAGGPVVGTGMVTATARTNSFTPNSSEWATKKYELPVGTNRIKFRCRSSFGNNLYLDNIKTNVLASAFANDLGTSLIVKPKGTLTLPFPLIAPAAEFTNYGTSPQFNVSVTFKITGPVNYTDSKLIPLLNSGASASVTFDSSFMPVNGSYQVSVYTNLISDQSRSNDTLKSVFNAVNTDYGSGAGYYYSNSNLSGAPSRPEYYRMDTSCSHSLIVNGVNKEPAKFSGNVDDGYFRLGNVFKGKKVRFGGVSYDSVFIGTNGIIGFTQFAGLSSASPAENSAVRPAFYPLWSDLDFSDPDVPVSRLSYKSVNGRQFIITYDKAPLYNTAYNPSEYISFQVVLELVESSSATNSNLIVQYGDTSLIGGTGLSYYNSYLLNTLPAVLIGLQYSAGNELVYRYRDGAVFTSLGPVFDNSPVALEFGPLQNALSFNGDNGLFYPRFGMANNSSAVEPLDYGSDVYQSNTDSFFVSKFDSSGLMLNSHFINLPDHPTALACSDDGYLYVGKENGGINKYDFEGNLVSGDFIPGIKAACILVNTVYDNIIYVADSVNQRISTFNAGSGIPLNINFIYPVNAMALVLFQNYLWVGTGFQNKLIVYNRSGDYITESAPEDIEKTRNVTSMFLSSDNKLYFFSRNDTLVNINGNLTPVFKFNLCGTDPSLPPPAFGKDRGPVVVTIVVFGVAVTVIVGLVVAAEALVTGNKTKTAIEKAEDKLPLSSALAGMKDKIPLPPRKVLSETFITPSEFIPEIHQGRLVPPGLILNLKILIEGFYNPVGNILTRDTVRIFLRNSVFPYQIIDSSKFYLNNDGTGLFAFPQAVNGVSYYLQTKHRNAIETWSKTGGEVFTNSLLNYDFTTAANKAFGNNQILQGSKWCIRAGDVNQDGIADAGDLSQVENDAGKSLSGYVPSDVNGDDIVDAADVSITENNSTAGVAVISP